MSPNWIPKAYKFEVTRDGRTHVEYIWASSSNIARNKLKALLSGLWGDDCKWTYKLIKSTGCPGL